MKTISKVTATCVAALGLVVGLNGCAEDNEKAALVDTTTGKTVKATAPAGTPRSSSAAYEKMKENDPLKNNKSYRQQ